MDKQKSKTKSVEYKGCWTERMERYCQRFIECGVPITAARQAGYKNPAVRIVQLMKNPKILARIEELRQDRNARNGVTDDRIIRELARIAFVNHQDIIAASARCKDVTEFFKSLSRDDAAAVDYAYMEEPETNNTGRGRPRKKNTPRIRYHLHAKGAALTTLAKIQGLLVKKVSVSDDTPTVGTIRVADLKLPLERKKELLLAIRAAQEKQKEKTQK